MREQTKNWYRRRRSIGASGLGSSGKKTVALLANATERGGAETYLSALGRELTIRSLDVVLIGNVPGWNDKDGRLVRVMFPPKINSRDGVVRQIVGGLLPTIHSLNHIRREKPDVVVVQYVREKLTFPKLLPRQKVVWIEHGPLPETLPQLAVRILRWQSSKSAVVSVSPGVQDSLRQVHIPSVVVPNPLPDWSSRAEPDATARPRIVYAGRIHRHKRLALLIEVAKRRLDWDFLIAGRGPDEVEIAADCPENVNFVGAVSDVRAVYDDATVAVLPSGPDAREGSPMSMLEARALGIPFVTMRDSHAAEEARTLGCVLAEPTIEGLERALVAAINCGDVYLPAQLRDDRSVASWGHAISQVVSPVVDGSD
ncbi:glycosyltransferase family 4 protein [Gordonia tangerina]|uniref:glycosyltransferase family 4 protein n=1 Tax=Gordonia tangerina TaxID=2911060 RepID=UPI003556A378